MAYGEKIHVIHKDTINGTTVTYRIELLENGYEGSSTRKNGTGKVLELGWDGVELKKIWDNPVQKGFLDLELLIESESDVTLLNDIVEGDEKEYQLRIKIDDDVKWTGFVIPDIIQYQEGPFPFSATLTAKDLHLLESEDFDNNTAISYNRYAASIAELANTSGLGLNLYIYDVWTAAGLDSAEDFFDQAYHDEFQLQDFTEFSEGNYGTINKLEALKKIIPPGFIFRQYNNRWNLIDIAHLAKDEGVVTQYEYDSAGTNTGKTTDVDLTTGIDRETKFLLRTSINKPYPGLKKVTLDYNHKTSIQHILFDSEYVHNDQSDRTSETLKVSDTTQRRVRIRGTVEVDTDTTPGGFRSGDAKVLVQVADEELDIQDGDWDVNNGEDTISVSSSTSTLTGFFPGTWSSNIPNTIGEDTLEIELRWAEVDGEIVQEVRWKNMRLELVNGEAVDNGATLHYELTQDGNYSLEAHVGAVVYGQGPNSLSNGAIRHFTSGAFSELSGFRHIGGTAQDYPRFVLENILNLQRVLAKSIDADLLAIYNPLNVITYRGDNYLFLNGSLTGRDSRWKGTIVQLNWNTDE